MAKKTDDPAKKLEVELRAVRRALTGCVLMMEAGRPADPKDGKKWDDVLRVARKHAAQPRRKTQWW